MDKKQTLRSLALLNLVIAKRERRKHIIAMLQDEYNNLSSFIERFQEENYDELESILKDKKNFEKDVTSLEKDIVSMVENIDIQYLEEFVSTQEKTDTIYATRNPFQAEVWRNDRASQFVNNGHVDEKAKR